MAALAGLRKMTSDDIRWLQNAEALLQKGLDPNAESQLCFAMGKYYDNVGEFNKAFLNYVRANNLSKSSNGIVFDRQGMTRNIDKLI